MKCVFGVHPFLNAPEDSMQCKSLHNALEPNRILVSTHHTQNIIYIYKLTTEVGGTVSGGIVPPERCQTPCSAEALMML